MVEASGQGACDPRLIPAAKRARFRIAVDRSGGRQREDGGGVRSSSALTDCVQSFELFVTLLAIFELLVFMGVVSPGFSVANFVKGWAGQDTFSLAAIPASLPRFHLRSGFPRD
jgi:hypothetical protein